LSDDVDLQSFFSELKTSVSSLETTVKETSEAIKTLEESVDQRFKDFEERLKAVKEQEEAREQEKPYGPPERPYRPPYGEPFIKSVLALIDKIKAKDLDDLKAKLKKMIGATKEAIEELLEGVVERTEEQYPAPAIAKALKYLKGKLSPREFSHVLKLLGVGKQTEQILSELLEVGEEETFTVRLPGRAEETVSSKEEALERAYRYAMTLGREHQE